MMFHDGYVQLKVALVAPIIAATEASWPEKFGRIIKMV